MAVPLSSSELRGLVVSAVVRALRANKPTNCTCPDLTTQSQIITAYCHVRALKAVGRVSVSVGRGMLVFALSKQKDQRLYTTLDDWPADEKIAGFLTFPVEHAARMSLRVNKMLLDAYVCAETSGATCVVKRLDNYLRAISLIQS